jgi:hypothetical protein
MFHFHWLMDSATVTMNADFPRVTKKAKKVLSVMFMGQLGSERPS